MSLSIASEQSLLCFLSMASFTSLYTVKHHRQPCCNALLSLTSSHSITSSRACGVARQHTATYTCQACCVPVYLCTDTCTGEQAVYNIHMSGFVYTHATCTSRCAQDRNSSCVVCGVWCSCHVGHGVVKEVRLHADTVNSKLTYFHCRRVKRSRVLARLSIRKKEQHEESEQHQ